MATSYPQDSYSSADLASADFAAEQSFTVTRAQGLVDLDLVLMTRPMALEFAEVTTTSGSFATIASFDIVIPEYAAAGGYNLVAAIEAKVDAGTAQWRLQENGDTVNGTTSSDITVTSYATSGTSVLVIASTWASISTRRLINIQGQITGSNTLSLRNLDRYTMWFSD